MNNLWALISCKCLMNKIRIVLDLFTVKIKPSLVLTIILLKYQNMNQEFVKLLIIGDSGVGKSSILSRYCEDKFSTAFFNTIGVDFKTKQIVINNTKCKMQIWDTAGQERFRTITSNYYRGAHGILIVFDVTSKLSFKDVDYWLGEIQRNSNHGNLVTILVGNKCDLVGKREVSEDQATAYARKNNIEYIEASALNSSNVSLVFETISKHILRKKPSQNQEKHKAQNFQSKPVVSSGKFINLQEGKNKLTSNCC